MRLNRERRRAELEALLLQFEDTMITTLVGRGIGIVEGTVMTPGTPPYRRLDCGGRAIAYVKRRPLKRALRIDVSGLWRSPYRSPLMIPTASSGVTLMVRTRRDLRDAIGYLVATVEGRPMAA